MNHEALQRKLLLNFSVILLLAALAISSRPASAQTCEKLVDLKLANTTITAAQSVAPGAFTPATGSAAPFKELPGFCRVTGVIKPTTDSDIKFEVWMPRSGWNRKFQGIGNGGFAGYIAYPELATAVARGYASASTDTGHTGQDASWALGHPEKIVDYGYRAVHEMTEKAKSIIRAFYGNGPNRSYFSSCSNGGRQALIEAQRYPNDYDGLIAGAPASYFTHFFAGFAWSQQVLLTGKLILYHGWADAALSPLNTINYFRSVVSKLGRRDAVSFVRLFMAPGMQHCVGGRGPDAFGALVPGAPPDAQHDISLALERWVEDGRAPDQIIASKRQSPDPKSPVVRARPLCPYPQVARYKGSGSTDDDANFVCVTDKPAANRGKNE